MFNDTDILNFLREHGIAYTLHHHEPIFGAKDVDIISEVKQKIAGAHVKNLFLRSERGFFLVTAFDDARVHLGALRKSLGLKSLSFADEASLMRLLGVTPGSVTPLALINDRDREIAVFVDQSVMASAIINVHPLRNDQTVSLDRDDLRRFFTLTGHIPTIVDVPKQTTTEKPCS